MGVAITNILTSKETSIEALQHKTLAVDAFNMLYQFLTTIRMRDGTPLKDSKGNVTSHLIGLFNRTTTLMSQGLKLAFVFDGEAPKLKAAERERRRRVKATALAQLKAATAAEDTTAMAKYAGRTARLTPAMIAEAKEVLHALGLPVVQAPSEGEAEAAYVCKQGEAYAVVSQDADSLLFGAPRVVKNLNVSGKRKQKNALAYETIKPELVTLNDNLQALNITHDQLLTLALLVGTDYNNGGVKGIGPKKALQLVQESKNDEEVFAKAHWTDAWPELDWREVKNTFTKLPVTDEYTLEWKPVDEEKLRELLVTKHDFSEQRVQNALEKIKENTAQEQKGLSEYF